MWSVCCKPLVIDDKEREEAPPEPKLSARDVHSQVAQTTFPVRANGGMVVVSEKKAQQQQRRGGSGPTPTMRLSAQELERRREKYIAQPRLSRDVPRGLEGEQVAAGWPAWLAAVAGEAIRGWVPRRADSFEKLDKIGQGTYSNVYRARDLDNGKVVALKKVRFDNLEPESVRFMAREIHILRRLDHPNIIKLEGLVTSRMSCSLYLVFEYMEHDLAGLASFPGLKFTEPQVKCYMQQLLRGLDHCHSRNVLHRDIKGSNLLIDNRGILKIGDFGLASFFDPDQNQSLTSRVVTLWYRPPELLLGATDYGAAVDLWSTGCILAELYAGKPIMPGRTEVEQLHKIFKLCGSPLEDYWRKTKLHHATIFKPQQPYKRCVTDTFKNFPASALSLIDILLSIDPADRGTADSFLKSEYFTTRPLACNPSSLPKYPPSKEFDAKIRDEETRRMEVASKVQRLELERKSQRESRAVPAPEANAELPSSLQKRQAHYGSRSRSEKFNVPHEDAASGFPIEPPRHASGLEQNGDSKGSYCNRSSHSGPLVHQNQWAKVRKNEDESPSISAVTRISASSLHAIKRTNLQDDARERILPPADVAASGRLSESGSDPSGSSRKYDQLFQSNGYSGSRRKEDRIGSKEQISQGYGSKGNKIHYSGPLRPSGNIDQTLRDHDRYIQEVFRRSRLDRSRVRRMQADGNNKSGTRPELGSTPIFPSSRGTLVFPSSLGAV